MMAITRRAALAGGTLAATLAARKPRAAELSDLATALKPVTPPADMPPFTFYDAQGKPHTLAEFHGHGMIINLWATWCAPCVAELPSLSALSKTLAPKDIAVLPLSSDHGGAKVVEAFFSSHDITGLPVLLDPKSEVLRALHARGLPTSVLVNRQGKECARLEGGADWNTPAAAALIERLVA